MIRKELIDSIDGIQHTKMDLSSNILTKNYSSSNNLFVLSKRHIYKSDSVVKRSESLKMTTQSKSNTIFISQNLHNQINESSSIPLDNFDINKNIKRLAVDSQLSENTIIFPSSDYEDHSHSPKSLNLELQS